MADCRAYFGATGRRVTFEYTLMAGVNDSPQHVRFMPLCTTTELPLGLHPAAKFSLFPTIRTPAVGSFPAALDVPKLQLKLQSAHNGRSLFWAQCKPRLNVCTYCRRRLYGVLMPCIWTCCERAC